MGVREADAAAVVERSMTGGFAAVLARAWAAESREAASSRVDRLACVGAVCSASALVAWLALGTAFAPGAGADGPCMGWAGTRGATGERDGGQLI